MCLHLNCDQITTPVTIQVTGKGQSNKRHPYLIENDLFSTLQRPTSSMLCTEVILFIVGIISNTQTNRVGEWRGFNVCAGVSYHSHKESSRKHKLLIPNYLASPRVLERVARTRDDQHC